MKSIMLVSSVETQHWKFCLQHHGISFTDLDYWNDSDFLHTVDNHNIIIDYTTCEDLFKYKKPLLLKLLSNNRLLLVANTDSIVLFRDSRSWLQQIDTLPMSSNLVCVLEADVFKSPFQNIQIDFDSKSRFFELVEQRVSIRLQKNYNKDFLLCMGREDVSRTLLWNHLQSDISKNSQMIYHRTNPIRDRQWTNYIGDNPAPLLWQRSCVPSLDLYNACCFEIAAETVTSDIRWFTEKTIRPIAASTPFVLLATPGSLSTLQSMGFKTFRSLINEDYDQEEHLEKRIRMIISTVEDIVSNGSKQFAIAAESITQHNWNRLAEIKGRFNLEKDRKFFGLLGIC